MDKEDKIKGVQEAEEKAKSMLENASKKRTERIEDAKAKANRMVEDAESEGKKLKEDMLKSTSDKLKKEREKGLAEARAQAKKIGKTGVKKGSLRSLVGATVKEILS